MTEFIVLGLVPGTQMQVSLEMWLVIICTSIVIHFILLKEGNIYSFVASQVDIYWAVFKDLKVRWVSRIVH